MSALERVFISYSRNDKADVDQIVSGLISFGVKKIFTDDHIEPGERWRTVIQERLAESQFFIIFLRSKPTQNQDDEIDAALRLSKSSGSATLIPVMLPGYSIKKLDQEQPGSFIASYNAIEFDKYNDQQEAIALLARRLTGRQYVNPTASDVEYRYVDAGNESNDIRLPGAFQADLNSLTSLLIGEAVYDDKDVCIREIIQNSNDACSRRRLRDLDLAPEPEIIVSFDKKDYTISFADNGDGMSASTLMGSFSVLGISANIELHSALSTPQETASAVTGKFGIGFVSTFMMADLVTISTKYDDEPPYHFQIQDPVGRITYTKTSICDRPETDVGTTVSIRLKDSIRSDKKIDELKQKLCDYCRHVHGLKVCDESGTIHTYASDWNVVHDRYISQEFGDNTYTAQLNWSQNQNGSIILSNGGFYVCHLKSDIIGGFPLNIFSGEFNIAPGKLDLNLARTGFVENEKVSKFSDIIMNAMRSIIFESEEKLRSLNLDGSIEELEFLDRTLRGSSGILDFYERRKSAISEKRLPSVVIADRFAAEEAEIKECVRKLFYESLISKITSMMKSSEILNQEELRRKISSKSISLIFEDIQISDRYRGFFPSEARNIESFNKGMVLMNSSIRIKLNQHTFNYEKNEVTIGEGRIISSFLKDAFRESVPDIWLEKRAEAEQKARDRKKWEREQTLKAEQDRLRKEKERKEKEVARLRQEKEWQMVADRKRRENWRRLWIGSTAVGVVAFCVAIWHYWSRIF